MKRALLLAGLIALAPLTAEAKDVPLNNSQIANAFSGRTINLGGSTAYYGKDKTYVFSGIFRGKWRVTNRAMCVTFDTGAWRCDKVVRDGKKLFFIDGAGNRTAVLN